MKSSALNRRQFLKGSAVLAATLSLQGADLPGARPRPRRTPKGPPEKLNIAVIGAGGRGANNLEAVSTENIVALCDVDEVNAAAAFAKYPSAAKYRDWRKLLEQEKNLDAVVISTPDHTHAIIAAAALRQGKHVYCEKPLTRTIHEARVLRELANKTGIVTQMGQQGHATEGSRRVVELLRADAIGEVTEVHVWTDRPAGWWPQGVGRPRNRPKIPKTLDWDLWLGPAPLRPYHPVYVPFKWRGFYAFGTGAIGDMAVHNFDAAYWGLELGVPTRARVVESAEGTEESPPLWSIIEMEFPKRGRKPPVKMVFYDGKKLPPEELFKGEKMSANGSLIIGKKGTIYLREWHGGDSPENMFLMLPRNEFENFEAPSGPRIERADYGHHMEWIRACKGLGTAQSNFNYASHLTESLLVGLLAVRTGKTIEWDADKMRARGLPEADRYIRPAYRTGWQL